MERLTERNKNGLAMAACCGKECEYNYVCEVGGFGECRGMDDIIDRLADIEDILGDAYDLDSLRELLEADKTRQFLATPCKVGSTVWYLTGNPSMTNRLCFDRVDSAKVAGFYFDERGLQIRLDHFHGSHGTYGFYGKTVFLTREAAEAALAKEAAHE